MSVALRGYYEHASGAAVTELIRQLSIHLKERGNPFLWTSQGSYYFYQAGDSQAERPKKGICRSDFSALCYCLSFSEDGLSFHSFWAAM